VLDRSELSRAIAQLAGSVAKRLPRLRNDIREAAARAASGDPSEVAFDLATRYKELRILGGLMQTEPSLRLDLLRHEGSLGDNEARQVLVLVDELELARALVGALAWVMPPWFVGPESTEQRSDSRVTEDANQTVRLVLLYTAQDARWAEALELHLRPLEQHERRIELWSLSRIRAGEDRRLVLKERLAQADVVLVLMSADFLASEYMVNEIPQLVREGKRVVPILLRPAMLESSPFAEFHPLPRNGKPISMWTNVDAAWLDVGNGIRQLLDTVGKQPSIMSQAKAQATKAVAEAQQAPQVLFSWLHLSDLHFGIPNKGWEWDQKLVLHSLPRDVREQLADRNRIPLDSVLVTGDIAYSGREYDEAKLFFSMLAQELGLSAERIFVVPGNHDVDWRGDGERQTRRLLRLLRDGAESMDEALADDSDRALLRRRQGAYLAFARNFAPACFSPSQEHWLFWRHRVNGPHGRLRLIGLNTALLAAEGQDQGKLRLGRQALTEAITPPPRAEDELAIVLSHHPLYGGWLADEKDLVAWMNGHAHVHLHGPVPDPVPGQTRSSEDVKFVRVVAGAPHRGPSEPRYGYNVGAILRMPGGEVLLRVWPRRWSQQHKSFRQDEDYLLGGRAYTEHQLRVRVL